MSDIERLSDEELAMLTEQARLNAITGTLMDDPLLSALEELARLRALTEWRFDMENAPKGENLYLFSPKTYNRHGQVALGDYLRVGFVGSSPNRPATAWFPLPPPPKVKP